ncbi:MAG: hypothetical protein IKB07_09680 [Lachnospiraceae bacterium]|nr:hypothetical protein [Lachnospiraceae bacterium]
MKKRKSIKTMIIAAVAAICVAVATPAVASAAVTKTSGYKYWCRAHSNNATDMYIYLSAKFSGKTCTDVWWDSSYSHWPNAFSCGSTASGYGYARGTYTAYTSLITQWVSIAFDSETCTIYLYN